MPRKSKAVLEREMRDWCEAMQRKGSGVRFIGFGGERPVLTQEQKDKLKRFFDDYQARTKPATKRKAA